MSFKGIAVVVRVIITKSNVIDAYHVSNTVNALYESFHLILKTAIKR